MSQQPQQQTLGAGGEEGSFLDFAWLSPSVSLSQIPASWSLSLQPGH